MANLPIERPDYAHWEGGQVLLPGDTPTFRSIAEDAMVKFDIARWLLTNPDTSPLADALTCPWGDA